MRVSYRWLGLLVWVLASTHKTAQFISDIESPPWLIGLFAFHSIAAVACFWMKRQGVTIAGCGGFASVIGLRGSVLVLPS